MRGKKKKESESFVEENIKFQYLSQNLTILATSPHKLLIITSGYANLRIPLLLGASSFYI